MNYQLLIFFVVLSLVNVILQTVKSILTINGTKFIAAVANAVAFGLYTVVVIYTVCDLPLWVKVIITATTNFVGVYISKWIVDIFTKDKLWKVEVTIPKRYFESVDFDLANIPHSIIQIDDKYTLFNFYCATQKESLKVKNICSQYQAKFFVSESKSL